MVSMNLVANVAMAIQIYNFRCHCEIRNNFINIEIKEYVLSPKILQYNIQSSASCIMNLEFTIGGCHKFHLLMEVL